MLETRSCELHPEAPFDFDLTAGSHTYFRGTYGADMLEGGDYRRLLNIDGRLLLGHVCSTGTTSEPALAVTVHGMQVSEMDLAAVSDIMGWNLGIDADMRGFYQYVREEPVLARLSSQLHGLHPTRAVSVFEAWCWLFWGSKSLQRSPHSTYSANRDLWRDSGVGWQDILLIPHARSLVGGGRRWAA